jgi:hypothetical protein
MLEEFYQVAFRKKLYSHLEALQADVDVWLEFYNSQRPHSGRYCYGKTPMQTFQESKHLVAEKMLDQRHNGSSAPNVVVAVVGQLACVRSSPGYYMTAWLTLALTPTATSSSS